MEDRFADLREVIYSTKEEKQRFRKLVVNCVMASDIVDKDLKALRNARWEQAFNKTAEIQEKDPRDAVNRKVHAENKLEMSDTVATVVPECFANVLHCSCFRPPL